MTYVSTVLADGAVGLYELGEASGTVATDQAAHQNGTYSQTGASTYTLGRTGIPGGAGATATLFTLGGSGTAGVTVADNVAQRMVNTFSIEMWVKLAATGTESGLFFCNSGNGPQLRVGTTGLLEFQAESVAQMCASTSGITDTTTWHHLVFTKSGTTPYCHIYLDGTDVTGAVSNQTLQNNATGYIFPGDAVKGIQSATYQMVAWYLAVLSPTQVSNHYTLGSSVGPTATGQPIVMII